MPRSVTRWIGWPLAIALLTGGCELEPPGSIMNDPDAAETAAGGRDATDLDPDDSSLLRRPFTAEEIRAEWRPGLEIRLRHRSESGDTWERWRVLAADEEGAELESTPIDAAGKSDSDTDSDTDSESDSESDGVVSRVTWVELRDHATFPARSASREATSRETPLGELDGWLYTVRDDESGMVSELFFARSLPGAPITMRVLRDGEVISEMAQVERRHAETGDDSGG